MTWRRVRQVRRVYPEFFLPPLYPILLCIMETGLRVDSEGVPYSIQGGRLAVAMGGRVRLESAAGLVRNTHPGRNARESGDIQPDRD